MPGRPARAISAVVSSAGKAGRVSGKWPQGSRTGRPAISQWPDGVSLPAAVSTAFLVAHGLVSVAWMALGAWILIVGPRMSDNVSLTVGGVIAGAAVVKLIIYDLSAISGLPRALAFIACGLILLGVVALRRSYADHRNAGRPAEAQDPGDREIPDHPTKGWGAPAATDATSSIEAGEAAPESGWGTPPRD